MQVVGSGRGVGEDWGGRGFCYSCLGFEGRDFVIHKGLMYFQGV